MTHNITFKDIGGLAQRDSLIDQVLVGTFVLAGVFLVFAGLKFVGLRKFIKLDEDQLVFGFLFFGFPIFKKCFQRSQVSKVELLNRRPVSNLAPQLHDDPQYYVQGHWRLVLTPVEGDKVILDKHVEREALTPLLAIIQEWAGL